MMPGQVELADQRPWPFRQFIVKLHSRCNLACDYCYVYTMADQRWRDRPRVMSRTVVDQTARRVAEHVAEHQLDETEVIIHGGEPLLAGVDALAHLASTMRSAVPARVALTVQTNGTLLDLNYLRLFRELDIQVGVSLDGGPAANDRHRVLPNGTGTYHRVRPALRSLQLAEFRRLFRGLLCTIDLDNDPVETYEALLEFAPPRVDFLLPHGNWNSMPPGLRLASTETPTETPYADWLIAVFERWYPASYRETGVRMFEEIINVLLGGHSRLTGIGLSPAATIVIETDGMIEHSDTLASSFPGAAATGLHVSRDSFDAALRLPAVQARQDRLSGLSAVCQECDLLRVCGGGLRAHRFRAGSGFHDFDNPSVYCADLYRLISHIRGKLARDLAALRQWVG
jgi:uncharacterized protein